MIEGGDNLQTAVQPLWPTPNRPQGGQRIPKGSKLGNGRTVTSPNGNKVQVHLSEAVKLWPTMTSSCQNTQSKSADHRTRKNGKSLADLAATVYGPNGEKVQTSLADRVFTTPSAHPRTHTPRDVDHGVQLANQIGGGLNPDWVEWLQGYPTGWTALRAWVIPWFRSKSKRRLKC